MAAQASPLALVKFASISHKVFYNNMSRWILGTNPNNCLHREWLKMANKSHILVLKDYLFNAPLLIKN